MAPRVDEVLDMTLGDAKASATSLVDSSGLGVVGVVPTKRVPPGERLNP